MQTVGEFLKEKREERGLTLEQVVIESRISMGMLKALEENHLARIPSEVFARGFIRLYAHHLQLDPEAVFEMFRPSISEFYRQAAGEEMVPDLSLQDPGRRPGFKMLMGALGLASLVFLSASAYFYWKPSPLVPTVNGLAEPAASGPDTVLFMRVPNFEDPGLNLLGLTVNVPQGESISELPLVEPDSQPEIPLPALTLLIEAIEESWVVAHIDDRQVKEVLLRPGEKVFWNAEEKFVLTLGNAGGVKLEYNGKPLDPPGKKGEVLRNLVLSR